MERTGVSDIDGKAATRAVIETGFEEIDYEVASPSGKKKRHIWLLSDGSVG